MNSEKRIVVIGQGYVGLNLAISAGKEFKIYGFDINAKLIERLSSGLSHIEDVSDSQIMKAIGEGRYIPTNSQELISAADIYVICVPTPLDHNREPDLSFLESATILIAEVATKPALIINESTSFPGTLRNYIKKKIEEISTVKHSYASSPERVDPGRQDYSQSNTPRLIGALDDHALNKALDFYSKFCNSIYKVSSPEVAEAAKLFENTFRQVNIALVNEFAQIAHSMQIPVREVLEAADTKPYGFMRFNPSAGVGGHCIPVDPSYLSFAAEESGINARFIDLANEVNLDMGRYVVERVVKDNKSSIRGKKVQIVGVAYKANVADTRETPAENIYKELIRHGAIVNWHDPLVSFWMDSTSSQLGSDIAIIVTLHDFMDAESILQSTSYVFDTTGKVKGATQL